MTPEAEARQEIDRQLQQCGWAVQDHRAMNLMAGLGVAVREFPLKTGFADYMLYADGQAIGVVEAKPVGHSLMGVEVQSAKYTTGLPDGIPNWHVPLPFAYESTGTGTRFTDSLDPAPRSREVFTFHRPEELIRLAKLGADQLRAKLRTMPELDTTRLWAVQIDAVKNLEASLADNRPRSLIQMATGSGKTFTACSICYRLIKFANAKRILFLVDRNNLGKQTVNEFQQYVSPYTNRIFTKEYNVQRLTKNTIAPASKVVVTTIQRLYSMLKGDEEYDEANEENSMFESAAPLTKEPIPVAYSPAIPIEEFDFIIIDECHRSIYNVWRQVLEYFDAFLVGLTATPTAQTLGFFRGNLVKDYSHEKAVADGVNVGYDVYRIQTKVTSNGATLVKEPAVFIPHRDRRTRQRRLKELDDDLTYTANRLDRDVVNESQIRLVIRTFKEKLFTEIFPGRTEVPKTLVFAKTDNHAEDIVKVIREEFGKGNDFCQKITSKTTGISPDELLSQFRNSYDPRIAVTVDMIATGTDVKPLECLLFMRNINSASYWEQMKGRGVRVINSDDLKSVTPDANSKTRFVIIDAVGVCENDKTESKPLDRQPSVSFEKLLQAVAQGQANADLVSTLAARLARLNQQIKPKHEQQIEAKSGGVSLAHLTASLLTSIDPDTNAGKAAEALGLPKGEEPTDSQIADAELQSMRQALRPFHNPDLRDALITIKSNLEQVIDETTQDELVHAGFNAEAKEKAKSLLADFRKFIQENKDQIEALKIFYSIPHRQGLRYQHIKDLAVKLSKPPFYVNPDQSDAAAARLWQAHEAVEPTKVKGRGGAMVDLVEMIRHAIDPNSDLFPHRDVVEQRYQAWFADQWAAGIEFTPEQRQWLDAIKDHLASSLHIDQEVLSEDVPFSQMGGLGKAYQLFGDKLSAILGELNQRLAA